MLTLYNQRDITYTTFFIVISALHVSGGSSAHHQELIKLYVQPWVLSWFPAVYRWCGWGSTPTTPAAATHLSTLVFLSQRNSSSLRISAINSFWCRIHLWFRLMGGLHAKSMTSQRYRATYKMADMRYYCNVVTTTWWRLYVILHLQQYSRRLNFFYLTKPQLLLLLLYYYYY